MKMSKTATKNGSREYIWARILKSYQIHLNMGPKISYLGIFALKFVNNIVMFEISALGFA